jgi:hypothetical protein
MKAAKGTRNGGVRMVMAGVAWRLDRRPVGRAGLPVDGAGKNDLDYAKSRLPSRSTNKINSGKRRRRGDRP